MWAPRLASEELTASGTAVKVPCGLYKIIMRGTAAASVSVYDGLDANSSRYLFTLYCGGSSVDSLAFDFGGHLHIERGIYLTLSASITRVAVVYHPHAPEDLRGGWWVVPRAVWDAYKALANLGGPGGSA